MRSPVRFSRIRLSQGQIFWREVGQGTPLIFLHGAYADGDEWLPVIEQLKVEQLKGEYHCLIPDLLGCGESEAPNIHHSVTLHTEYLAEFIDALRLEKVYLVGHSIGGWIATQYAVEHLEQVQGLILIAPEGIDTQNKQRWRKEKRLLSWFPLFYWTIKAIAPFSRFFKWRTKIKELLQYRKKLLTSPASSQLLFKRRKTEIEQEYLNRKLPLLDPHVLLLQGEQDEVAVLQQTQTFARIAPRVRLKVMEEGGSNLIEEWPKNIAQEIRNFLQSREAQKVKSNPESLVSPSLGRGAG